MIVDFKNIQFKYVKIENGVSSIDTSMTDKKFIKTKPKGYYKCFIFPNTGFAGNDYDDLRNLISIESSEMWDKTNRDTFLGYNAEDKKFIINMSAYMGLKDPDLQIKGDANHTEQASWQIMDTTTVNDAIINLDETDGSILSLKPAESEITSPASVKGKIVKLSSIGVDNIKKSVINAKLLVKTNDEQLWAKSPEDGSPIMVNNFIKSVTVDTNVNKLERNNRQYGYTNNAGYHYYDSVYKYGKKVISFDSISSINSIDEGNVQVRIQNKSESLDIELKYTNNLNDILKSGESLQFEYLPIAENLYFVYDTKKNKTVQSLLKVYFSKSKGLADDTVLVENSDHSNNGVRCNLLSLDSSS